MSSSVLARSLVLGTLTLFACGNDPANPAGADAPPSTPDASTGDPPPPARGFQLKSPDITIPAGAEQTYCWYFQTPNTETLAIKKWLSHMTPGSHHMIMYTTSQANAEHPVGSPPTRDRCGVGTASASNVPIWTYSAQNADQELPMPTDDGTGMPVGQEIAAGQYGYLEMHYNNKTDQDLVAHVTLNGEAYEAGTAYTKTAAYVTYNGSLSIPPGTSTATQMCDVPATAKFWTLSTHAHKRATKTEVKDGAEMKFMSTDWEHPGAAAWNPGFNSFATGKLTYSCTYFNETNSNIQDGDSADTNEMCMAVGYFFPATKPTICYDSFVLPF